MICPNCHEKYPDYEVVCPACRVPLVERLEGVPEPEPDLVLVPVFEAEDAAVLPLAELTLQGEKIEYLVRRSYATMRSALRQGTTDFNNPLVAQIVVASDVADRARDLLSGLEGPTATTTPDPDSAGIASSEWVGERPAVEPEDVSGDDETMSDARAGEWSPGTVIRLTDLESHMAIGMINGAQLQQLVEMLEEPADNPQQYYIDENTIDMLVNAHADAGLVSVLRSALGTRDGMEIEWSRG